MRSGSRLAREIKLRMTTEKQHATRRRLHQQSGQKCDEGQCPIWSAALNGAEPWTLRKVDDK